MNNFQPHFSGLCGINTSRKESGVVCITGRNYNTHMSSKRRKRHDMGSEAAIKKALVDRYPSNSYTQATKLTAMMMAPSEKAAKNQFYTSLERTGAGYFDYYLLHAMMEGGYIKYDKFHL